MKYIILIAFSAIFVHPLRAQLSEKDIKNSSTFIKRNLFEWKIYIDAENVLPTIDSVVYTLHPTFRNPVVTGNPLDRFSYQARGWGEFLVRARVKYKDGHVQQLTHWLEL